MHQILKTRQLIYIPPVQDHFFQLRTWLECGSHRFVWQQTVGRRVIRRDRGVGGGGGTGGTRAPQ